MVEGDFQSLLKRQDEKKNRTQFELPFRQPYIEDDRRGSMPTACFVPRVVKGEFEV